MTRPTCTFCARKHLSQAYVLCEEAQQGYPEHVWLAIGHMAEASAELLEKYPAMAAAIRTARTDLERSMAVPKQPWAFPDFIDLIKKVAAVPDATHQQAPGRHQQNKTIEDLKDRYPAVSNPPPTASGASAPKLPVSPEEAARLRARATTAHGGECGTCFDNARKTRWEAENPPNLKIYPRGRLLILTTLANFSPSYSLTTVILDQAVAAAAAGYRVTIGVHVGCDLADMPPLPPAIDVVGIIPKLPWKQNEIVEEHVGFIVDALQRTLDALGPCKIISHDLLFQEWFCTVAKAIHVLPDMPDVFWYHLCHSSVAINDPLPEMQSPRFYRRCLPRGHKLLILNYSDTDHFLKYYCYNKQPGYSDLPASQIRTLLNPRDCRVFQGMSEAAVTLISKHTPHLVDVAQVYPLSLTRLAHKYPELVIELFAEIKRLGMTVRLIFATSHANAAEHQMDATRVKAKAQALGLTDEEVIFTHESLPETAATGLDRDTIRSLFSVTNLFAFPSESEAGSLVLMEAAQSGNLLVLNESLPCLRDYVPTEMALWVPWGSIKEPGRGVPMQPLAESILDRLDQDMSMKSKRHMLRLSSLEAYSERLVEVLEG